MALQTMIDKLNTAKKTYDAQLKEIADQGKEEIGRHLAPLIPPGWALFWTQYTPYFNDGDACHFSVRDVYLIPEAKIEDVRRSSSAEEDGFSIRGAKERYGKPDEECSRECDDYSRPKPRVPGLTGYQRQEYEKRTHTWTEAGFPSVEGYPVEKFDELAAAWNAIPEDVMERMFGDHARCVVKSDGTASADEYEHD